MGRLGDEKKNILKETILSIFGLVLFTSALTHAVPKDLEIKGKQLISQKPAFTFTLPSELSMIYSFSHEYPAENSLTRAYFLVRVKAQQVEEMLIIQIADKTNPQAEPILAPPLKPYTERRMYRQGRKKEGALEFDYLIQLMAWNPNAPSLQPIRKKGIRIPSHWAMQGQLIFVYQGEHVVYIRYSKDVNAFGLNVTDKGNDWDKGAISGKEKRVFEIFQKSFMGMVNSIQIKNQ